MFSAATINTNHNIKLMIISLVTISFVYQSLQYNEKIEVYHDSSKVDEIKNFDAYFHFIPHPNKLFAPLVDGKNACDHFPVINQSLYFPGNMILMIWPSRFCSSHDQQLSALKTGYKVFIFSDKPDLDNESYFINTHKELQPYRYFMLVVNESQALLLMNYTFDKGFILYYTKSWDRFLRNPTVSIFFIFSGLLFHVMLALVFFLPDLFMPIVRRLIHRLLIYTLPSRRCIEDDTDEFCPICFDEYVIGHILCCLHCGHEFHRSCLAMWGGEKCPLCRAPMNF